MAHVDVTGLAYRLPDGRPLFDDVSFRVGEGVTAGLVGPNGAGKTTLLNLAAGLLTPTSGSIEVLGARPAASPAQLAKVGFVPQDTPTYGGLSIAEHLRLSGEKVPSQFAAEAELPTPPEREAE